MSKNIVFKTIELTKKYKKFTALDHASMNIYEGDIYGFVGENGAGKTTLIRLACGLIHPNEGEYELFGVSNKSLEIEKAKKQMSAIVESVSINPGLTAYENLVLQCNTVGIKKTKKELIQTIIDVGLNYEDIKKKKAGSFSLGMRQRLGLAVALISDPKFILLDEPMNGLDPQGFVDMRETILHLNRTKGVTFLISSHILAELDKICTRVGFLSHGRLLAELSVDELHEKALRKIIIKAKDINKVEKTLTKALKLENTNVDGDFLSIYDNVDINDVLATLVKKKIVIASINLQEETIEDFYKSIMNGGN